MGLLAKSVLNEIRENRKAVAGIASTLAGHAQSLKDGNQRFTEMNREIGELRASIARLERDGCAHRKDCA